MRYVSLFALAVIGLAGGAPAFAQDVEATYTSGDVIRFMMEQKKASQGRALCIGTDAECADKVAKPAGFDLVINFDKNSANLRPESKANLKKVAEALRNAALEEDSFRIEGFTDAMGSEKYNMTLSRERAKSVKRFLAENDVDASRMTTVGLGETSPRDADPFSPDNRRVELKLKVN